MMEFIAEEGNPLETTAPADKWEGAREMNIAKRDTRKTALVAKR